MNTKLIYKSKSFSIRYPKLERLPLIKVPTTKIYAWYPEGRLELMYSDKKPELKDGQLPYYGNYYDRIDRKVREFLNEKYASFLKGTNLYIEFDYQEVINVDVKSINKEYDPNIDKYKELASNIKSVIDLIRKNSQEFLMVNRYGGPLEINSVEYSGGSYITLKLFNDYGRNFEVLIDVRSDLIRVLKGGYFYPNDKDKSYFVNGRNERIDVFGNKL